MRELKRFVENLKAQGFQTVSIGEVGNGFEVEDVDKLFDTVKVKEVVAEYYNSFEFIDTYGKYIEVKAVC